MKNITLALALLLPLVAQAQVHKCVGADGKVIFTERLCDTSSTTKNVDIPLSTELTPQQRRVTAVESKERTASDRREAIGIMLRDGRVNEARTYARTAEERALVSDAASAQRQDAKDAKRAREEQRMAESSDRLRKALTRR